jgi:hypothetical protein
LFHNDWFRRVWVLQEVGLAKNPRVVYDEIDFSYRELMAVVTWLMDNAFLFAIESYIRPPRFHVYWPDWRGEGKPAVGDLREDKGEMVDLISCGSLLACQDPRDLVYAFLGHPLAKSNNGAIIPDYEKEVLQVYRGVTEYLMAETGIRALSVIEHTDATFADSETPSWVIRWNDRSATPILWSPSLAYHACGDRAVAQIAQENDTLLIRGLEVDTVVDVYQVVADDRAKLLFFSHPSSPQALSLEDMISQTSTLSIPCLNTNSHALTLAWTLCAGRHFATLGIGNLAAAWNAYRLWARSPPCDNMHPLAHSFWRCMQVRCACRALVVTKKRYYGLVPALSRPGDLCCVFDGGAVPFICRPMHLQSGGSSRDVRLVGEACVHGLSNGQSVDMFGRGEAKERVFRIT